MMQFRAVFRNKGDCRNRNHDDLPFMECRMADKGQYRRLVFVENPITVFEVRIV